MRYKQWINEKIRLLHHHKNGFIITGIFQDWKNYFPLFWKERFSSSNVIKATRRYFVISAFYLSGLIVGVDVDAAMIRFYRASGQEICLRHGGLRGSIISGTQNPG